MRNQFFTLCFVMAAIGALQDAAEAQFNSDVFRRNASTVGRGTTRNPRQSILSRPSTSPYLALTDLTGNGFDNSASYFTSVRPRLEFERGQQQQQMQLQNVQRQVTTMRTQAARQNQNGVRATGHPTRFQFYLHYYPTLR